MAESHNNDAEALTRRTIVDLPDEQIAGLADLCEKERISRAEAVRRAVADYLKARHSTERGWSFGMWRKRGIDGVEYQRKLRDEWR